GQRLTSQDITGRKATYDYDADGWLTKETVSGAPGAGNGAVSYVLDGVANRLSRTSTLPAIPSATYAYNSNNQLATAGYDGHGNITFLTSPAGTVTDSYDYDAWGLLIAHTGSTPNTRLYAGEEFDPDLGLIALRARLYDPDRGRFTTIDPVMGKLEYPVSL